MFTQSLSERMRITGILQIAEEAIVKLENRAVGLARCRSEKKFSYGRKVCPTRHGCQGATDCNYSYGDYPD